MKTTRETAPTSVIRGSHPTKFEMAAGQFFLNLARWAVSPIVRRVGKRILAIQESKERQRQLSEFWQSEQRRLWPMLQGSFDKIENWDSWHQLFAFAERLQSAGMTVKEVSDALKMSGHALACDGKVFIPPLNTTSTISYVFK